MKLALSHFVAFITVAFGAISAAGAPSPTPNPTPAASPCAAPEFHQFDFWLGHWTVRTPDGKTITGKSQISRASDGCAILEQWKAVKGSPGISINYYDTATQHWHQLWVGGGGTILKLEGEFKDGAMVLEGESDDPRRVTPLKNRITWTPMPEGKVKQEWATSEDGKAWQTGFVGIYSHD